MVAGEVERRTGEGAAQHLDVLSRPGETLVVAEDVAVGALLGRVLARDDVEREPTAGDRLECLRLLGHKSRQREPGMHRLSSC
jgi:hypothetical protein